METNEELDDKKIKRKIQRNNDRSEALKKILEELEKRKPVKNKSKSNNK